MLAHRTILNRRNLLVPSLKIAASRTLLAHTVIFYRVPTPGHRHPLSFGITKRVVQRRTQTGRQDLHGDGGTSEDPPWGGGYAGTRHSTVNLSVETLI